MRQFRHNQVCWCVLQLKTIKVHSSMYIDFSIADSLVIGDEHFDLTYTTEVLNIKNSYIIHDAINSSSTQIEDFLMDETFQNIPRIPKIEDLLDINTRHHVITYLSIGFILIIIIIVVFIIWVKRRLLKTNKQLGHINYIVTKRVRSKENMEDTGV